MDPIAIPGLVDVLNLSVHSEWKGLVLTTCLLILLRDPVLVVFISPSFVKGKILKY